MSFIDSRKSLIVPTFDDCLTIIGGNKMSLKVGDAAPDFELASHTGNKVKLSDFKGIKNVFIAFYPLDWTPV
jgi:peroxiredoxin